MKPNPKPWLKKGRVATGEAWPFVEDEPGPFWFVSFSAIAFCTGLSKQVTPWEPKEEAVSDSPHPRVSMNSESSDASSDSEKPQAPLQSSEIIRFR